jgi:hypothetical protein
MSGFASEGKVTPPKAIWLSVFAESSQSSPSATSTVVQGPWGRGQLLQCLQEVAKEELNELARQTSLEASVFKQTAQAAVIYLRNNGNVAIDWQDVVRRKKMTMDLNTIAADLGLSPELAKEALKNAAVRAAHEYTKRANDASHSPPSQIAVMDKTLGRLRRRYEERLQNIALPASGFVEIEQARKAGRLSATYRNLRDRQIELGLEPEPKDARVVEAERLAEAFYRHVHRHTRGDALPARRGRPPRQRSRPASPRPLML